MNRPPNARASWRQRLPALLALMDVQRGAVEAGSYEPQPIPGHLVARIAGHTHRAVMHEQKKGKGMGKKRPAPPMAKAAEPEELRKILDAPFIEKAPTSDALAKGYFGQMTRFLFGRHGYGRTAAALGGMQPTLGVRAGARLGYAVGKTRARMRGMAPDDAELATGDAVMSGMRLGYRAGRVAPYAAGGGAAVAGAYALGRRRRDPAAQPPVYKAADVLLEQIAAMPLAKRAAAEAVIEHGSDEEVVALVERLAKGWRDPEREMRARTGADVDVPTAARQAFKGKHSRDPRIGRGKGLGQDNAEYHRAHMAEIERRTASAKRWRAGQPKLAGVLRGFAGIVRR